MQKKLIALAIAGLASSAAFAQSNVTIYGVFDGTLEDVKASGATAGSAGERPSMTRASSNSSYIGFKGVEDLGGGNKAVFQLENQFDVQNGGGPTGLANRDTFVGLTGGWGTVVTGNLTDPARLFGAKAVYDPGATSIGFTGGIFGKIATGGQTGVDNRKPNAWAYVTPDFSGFSAVAAHVSGENAANGSPSIDTHAWEGAVMYTWQKLFVGYAHIDFTDGLGADTKVKADRVVGAYAFPTGTSVSALWDQFKADGSGIGGDFKRKAWGLSVNQNFGPNNVWLEYAKAKEGEGSSTAIAPAIGAGTGAKQWTLGYSYDLSKRTMIHAYYAKITNDSNAKYDFYVNPVGTAAGAVGAGADPQGYGVGIRHNF